MIISFITGNKETYNGAYSLSGSTLNMKDDDDENIPYAVSELTSNSLKFSYSGNGQQIEY